MGLFYVDNQSSTLDLKLMTLTVLNSINRQHALLKVSGLLKKLGVGADIVRGSELVPHAPPGASAIVQSR